MVTYLPSPFNFLNWSEVLKNFKKGKEPPFPKCIELNVCSKRNFNLDLNKELDIYTIENLLREFKKRKLEWLVLGWKGEIFLHKSIKTFIKLLNSYELNVFTLKTNGLYINRISYEDLFRVFKNNNFIKKEKSQRELNKEIFLKNLFSLLEFLKKNENFKTKIYLKEEEYDLNLRKEIGEKGGNFLKKFKFFDENLFSYLPYIYLFIDSNGFCYSFLGNKEEKIKSIFFNSILKIWHSKALKNIRKNNKGNVDFYFLKQDMPV